MLVESAALALNKNERYDAVAYKLLAGKIHPPYGDEFIISVHSLIKVCEIILDAGRLINLPPRRKGQREYGRWITNEEKNWLLEDLSILYAVSFRYLRALGARGVLDHSAETRVESRLNELKRMYEQVQERLRLLQKNVG